MKNMFDLLFSFLVVVTISNVGNCHGHMSFPVIRGAHKTYIDIDSLRNPIPSNRFGRCRFGKPSPRTTILHEGPLNVALDISAPHIGPCFMFLCNQDLTVHKLIAKKENCAAPNDPDVDYSHKDPIIQSYKYHWHIDLPHGRDLGCQDRCVLRFEWRGEQNSVIFPELYENCADISIATINSNPSSDVDNVAINPKCENINIKTKKKLSKK
ncbi:hypothetical protein ROZALSC1DRAFT_19921 [Rozella allomycis CSF55]|uniref:Chitin-binding type-4 domain-containing protein n=1 Tax=Rozella allomycis (strain CSF55) TaxID=988480 RepID=A0A4P9YQT8_ROZAC|nr:hypothetical protein ROZALSC1DRAFT_19921 [Rozella allomycis CSF55]